MAIKLVSTNHIAHHHGVKMLVYGRAGAGKTTLCATAHAPIILSAEAGILSLRRYNIPVIQIKTIYDLFEAKEWVSKSSEAKNFHTICIDSLTEIGEVILSDAKQSMKDPRKAYGRLIEEMGRIIRSFRDLSGKHIYMTSKLEVNKDDITGISLSGPSMPGSKLSQQLPYLFDEVFHLGVKKDEKGKSYRYLRTDSDLQFEAKDRSGRLSEIEAPNLTYVINKILGNEQQKGLI